MPKDAQMTIRISAELKQKLQELATADKRTVSDYVALVLEEHASKKKGR